MIRQITTTLEDMPIYFAFDHDEHGPSFVEATRHITRCAQLKHALALLPNPTINEGARVFKQIFDCNLRACLHA